MPTICFDFLFYQRTTERVACSGVKPLCRILIPLQYLDFDNPQDFLAIFLREGKESNYDQARQKKRK